ncbi:DUF3226 domain-containing protein [Aliarcobacter butzleri]|uniref:DUF3226 domain-containing protein n=1 Tax=Aliarcobacter butzleri TaxID=28197 RepID=UPI003AF5DC07
MQRISNITILFCEGPHDTAFLYRVLKTKCYEVYNDSLLKLPKIVGEFIESKNKHSEYNKLKIDSLKNDFAPYRILLKEDRLILMYSLGGDRDGKDDKDNKRLIILNHYFNDILSKISDSDNYGKAFSSEDIDGNIFKYNFLFFYDADDDKNQKISIANEYLKKLNLDFCFEHNKIIKYDQYSFGLYIFSNNEDKGSLEDILFGMMKKDNDKIFEEAEKYYEQFFDEARAKRLVTIFKDGNIVDIRKGSIEKDQKKSLICIAGQLQKKGKSNVVVIEDTDYLTLDKINSDAKLQEIAFFIENSKI